jgi:hypothetical protein
MFRDEGHPDVSLADWSTFRSEFSPYLFEEILDRSSVGLPDWFMPLARGAAIPSLHLLQRAGYRPGSHRARGWLKPPKGDVWKDYGRDCLVILRAQPLWRIELNNLSLGRPHNHSGMTLVHIFGSTPIFTRNYQSATHLAEFCLLKGPPPGLRWVEECPDDMNGAINFSLQRRADEARAARSLGACVAA